MMLNETRWLSGQRTGLAIGRPWFELRLGRDLDHYVKHLLARFSLAGAPANQAIHSSGTEKLVTALDGG
jgi:hypothetical protein